MRLYDCQHFYLLVCRKGYTQKVKSRFDWDFQGRLDLAELRLCKILAVTIEFVSHLFCDITTAFHTHIG